jgi:hypothetical protein
MRRYIKPQKSAKRVTKSIRLTEEEAEALAQLVEGPDTFGPGLASLSEAFGRETVESEAQ